MFTGFCSDLHTLNAEEEGLLLASRVVFPGRRSASILKTNTHFIRIVISFFQILT
jgi:hypothetical protein